MTQTDVNNVVGRLSSNVKPVEISARTGKPKRRKAVRACTNCQRTHLTCDDNRPCERCVKRGYASSCVDGPRKPTRTNRQQRLMRKLSSPESLATPPTREALLAATPTYSDTFDMHYVYPEAVSGEELLSPPGLVYGGSCGHSIDGEFSSSTKSEDSGSVQSPYAYPPEHLYHHHHHHHHHGHHDNHHHRHSHSHDDDDDDDLSENSDTAEASQHGRESLITSMLRDEASRSPTHYREAIASSIPPLPTMHSPSLLSQSTTHSEISEPRDAIDKMALMPSYFSMPNTLSPRTQYRMLSDAYKDESWLNFPMNPFMNVHEEHLYRRYNPADFDDEPDAPSGPIYPFNYIDSFRRLINELQKRLPEDMMAEMRKHVTYIVNSGLYVERTMTLDDRCFIEQTFQRLLQEEKRQMRVESAGCVVWRRSGVISALNESFTRLTGWTLADLQSTFITSIMDLDGAINYFRCLDSMFTSHSREFKLHSRILNSLGQGIDMTMEVTIQRDIFGLPIICLGKFWKVNEYVNRHVIYSN